MADQPKKKPASQIVRNSDRRNGKASKQDRNNPKFRIAKNEYRGSHTTGTSLTELQKALMGGGAMKRIMKRIPGSISR